VKASERDKSNRIWNKLKLSGTLSLQERNLFSPPLSVMLCKGHDFTIQSVKSLDLLWLERRERSVLPSIDSSFLLSPPLLPLLPLPLFLHWGTGQDISQSNRRIRVIGHHFISRGKKGASKMWVTKFTKKI